MSFDFTYADLAHSNLGGMGPDTWAPASIRYVNVGAASVPLPGGGAFTFRFDLEVTALSAYVPYNASLNGLNGRFAQINLAANEEVELRATSRGEERTARAQLGAVELPSDCYAYSRRGSAAR